MRSVTRRLALAVAAGAALSLAACNGAKGGGSGDTEIWLGKADAPVTVVEYASTTCGHCAKWNEEVWPAFKAKYVDTGQVRYTMREMLTPPYEVASAGFLLARCAGKDKYHQVIDALFRSQQEMARTGDARGTLLRVAQSAGMTEAQFNACITDEEQIVALNERVEGYVQKEKVDGTPTFVINGKKLESGEKTLAQLDAEIQPLLRKKPG